MSKTNAVLTAEVEALRAERDAAKAEAEALRNRTQRERVYGALFPNQNMRPDRSDPPWQGAFRFVIPDGFRAGDYIWIDESMWDADPSRYDSDTPPDFSTSYSATPPDRAKILEDRRNEYLASRATTR